MKSLKSFSLFIALAIILILIILARGNISAFYINATNLLSSVFDRSFDYEYLNELQRENERLRFELANAGMFSKEFDEELLLVPLYSHYPFSDRNLIVINAGIKDGVKTGVPVLTKEGFLLGVVTQVKNTQAEVQTIFDSEWKTSVAVGSNNVKAVFRGGATPYLELIPAENSIEPGDNIFNISSEFPFHQLIGTVKLVEEKSNSPWLGSTVRIPYNLETLDKVLVFLFFP